MFSQFKKIGPTGFSLRFLLKSTCSTTVGSYQRTHGPTWVAREYDTHRPRGVRYRGTSLIRKRLPPKPYSNRTPRGLDWSYGGGRFFWSEVPLHVLGVSLTCKSDLYSTCGVLRGSRCALPLSCSRYVETLRYASLKNEKRILQMCLKDLPFF